MSSIGVEALWSNLFELKSSHHGVEEDLEEVHVVFVGGFHELNPLDSDLVLGAIVLCFQDWNVIALSERVDTGTPVDVEFQLLLEFVSDRPQNILAEFLGVVWNLRRVLASVLVDSLDASLVKFNLEVVGVHLQGFTRSLGVSSWLLGEQLKGVA